MKKKGIKVIATILAVFLILGFLQRLLEPKYMTDIVEGALIGEYYDSEKVHDVIFLGDCEVYENFSPCRLWEQYGISSYVRGSAQQLIWQSYYLLEDTLRYEKPQAVVFNIMSLMHNEPENEAYNRMTLDGMRWSWSKVKSIQASMLEDEDFLDYVFPILRYHTRWQELKAEDFRYLFHRDKVSYEGYYMRVDVKAAENVPEPKRLANYRFGENALFYMDKIRELCEKEGVDLILVKAPSLYPHWYEEWDDQVVEYAQAYGLPYYNFLDRAREIGVDYSTDTYDGGLHMNLSGATKLSDYFGEILQKEHGIPDRRQEESYCRIWEPKLEDYYQGIQEREEALR